MRKTRILNTVDPPFFIVKIFSFFLKKTLNYKIREINFITCHLMAAQSAIIMSRSIMRFLKLIDGIPVPNDQLLSLVHQLLFEG